MAPSDMLGIERHLADIQVRWPMIDVPAQWRRACAKYQRPVEPGWLEAFWLPRCRPVRRRSRAVVVAAVATDLHRRAAAATEPTGWAAWWAKALPGVDLRPWQDAPIDLRLRFVREGVDSARTGEADALETPVPRSKESI